MNRGKAFEKEVSRSFPVYLERSVARLAMMPVSMAPLGLSPKHNRIVYTPSGKSPFDVYGYWMSGGKMIAAELKSSARKKALPIRDPTKKKGDGIQYHQLASLALLIQAGGSGYLLWENGGEVLSLHGSKLLERWRVYDTHWKSKQAGNSTPQGWASIDAELFEPVPTVRTVHDWLRRL